MAARAVRLVVARCNVVWQRLGHRGSEIEQAGEAPLRYERTAAVVVAAAVFSLHSRCLRGAVRAPLRAQSCLPVCAGAYRPGTDALAR